MNLSIAFLSRDLPSGHPNGVSCQVDLLANRLVDQGHRVTVFSLDPKPEGAKYSVVQCVLSQKVGRITRLLAPARVFAQQDYGAFDLIHAHGDDYLVHTPTPLVRTFYGSALWESLYDHRPLYRLRQALFYPLEWLSVFKSSVSTGISKATQKALPRIQHIVPCAVDSDFFQPGEEKSKHPTILFVGNLSGRKRGWALLRLFQTQVLPHHPKARLVLVTPQSLPYTSNVEMHGSVGQKELLDLYQRAWMLCITSTYEGFGVPMLEAMACKVPVITTPHKGALELIESGKNGIICKLSEMAKWIDRLLSQPDVRETLAQKGNETVQKYSIQSVAARYEAIYQQVLSSA